VKVEMEGHLKAMQEKENVVEVMQEEKEEEEK
jgi:hypothetical protein